jgi:hypothetical protein
MATQLLTAHTPLGSEVRSTVVKTPSDHGRPASAPRRPRQDQLAPEVAAYVKRLIDAAALETVPSLFDRSVRSLYSVDNRQGVSVIAAHTRDLSNDQLRAILRYQLAQYLVLGYVDPGLCHAAGLEHEPISEFHPDDVHIVVGAADSGTILCYMTVRRVPDGLPGVTLRSRNRPLLYLEKLFGWGVLNRLNFVPDMPLRKIRQVRSIVKNQLRHTSDELGARSAIEIGVALVRTLVGPLRQDVDVIVGEITEEVLWHNFDYLYLPNFIQYGALSYATGHRAALYERWPRYPSGCLIADIEGPTLARQDQIEAALALPGRQATAALMALRRTLDVPKSSAWPSEGPPALAAVKLPQQALPMPRRRELLDVGQQLRAARSLADLTVGESAILATMLERRTVAAGTTIVEDGARSPGLFVIVSGEVDLVVPRRGRSGVTFQMLKAGDSFGEISLVSGSCYRSSAVAATNVELLWLSAEVCAQYLADLPDVQHRLAEAAAHQAVALLNVLQRPA